MPTEDTSFQTEIELLKQQLARLEARLNLPPVVLVAATPSLSSPKATGRRRVLKQMAAVLLAGAASLSSLQSAEAKMTVNPTDNGMSGRVGAFITPPGTAAPDDNLGGTGTYGMIISGTTTPLNFAGLPAVISSGNSYGLLAITTGGYSVVGNSTSGIGVYGNSTNNIGVYGNSNSNIGVYGVSSNNRGVYGISTNSYGVQGFSTNGSGVFGYSSNSYGVHGYSATNYSGYFSGNVRVIGTLTKGANAFKIDHPTDPANKYLYHSVVESPDMLNIYNGNTTLDGDGQATITMPPWFEALNKDFRYQLTAIGGASPNLHISLKLNNGSFTIGGGLAGQEVSWQVTGIRQDAYANAHRIPVEEDKSGEELGKYLHPEVHGQTAEAGINFERNKVGVAANKG